MLAEAEEEDSRIRNGGGSPHVRKMQSTNIKPSAIASKYGIDVVSDGEETPVIFFFLYLLKQVKKSTMHYLQTNSFSFFLYGKRVDSDDDFDEEDEAIEMRDPNPNQPQRQMDDRELGQLAAMAQENMQLRSELDERKTQVQYCYILFSLTLRLISIYLFTNNKLGS